MIAAFVSTVFVPSARGRERVVAGTYRILAAGVSGREKFKVTFVDGRIMRIETDAVFVRGPTGHRALWVREGDVVRYRFELRHMESVKEQSDLRVERRFGPYPRRWRVRGNVRDLAGRRNVDIAVHSPLILDSDCLGQLYLLFQSDAPEPGPFSFFVPRRGKEERATMRSSGVKTRAVWGRRYRLHHFFMSVENRIGVNIWRDEEGNIVRISRPADAYEAVLVDTNTGAKQTPFTPVAETVPRPESGFDSHLVAFDGDSGRLAGTLTVPQGLDAPAPGVVLAPEDGSSDRDGNRPTLRTGLSKALAEGLAERGFVVLRYDKRSIGKSDRGPPRFRGAVDDYIAAIRFLRGYRSCDPARMFLLGHSEGALVAALAAREIAGSRGVALLAPSPRPVGELVLKQAEYLARLRGETPVRIGALLEKERAEHQRLRGLKPKKLPTDRLGEAYLHDVLLLDPPAVFGALRTPVLVLGAGRDYQAGAGDARRVAALLRQAGNQRVTFDEFPKLDHVFMPCPKPPSPVYFADESRKPDAAVLDAIADWIKENE